VAIFPRTPAVPLPSGLLPGLLLGLLLLPAAAASAADFLGPESCKGCHPEAYTIWQQNKHARAADDLTAEQAKDARCVSCHAPDQKAQQVSHVTCETCHGGGQYYSPTHVMKDPELSRLVGLLDPGEKQCRSCHDASTPSLTPFDFKTALKAIDHWSPAALERARSARAAPAAPPAGKSAAAGKAEGTTASPEAAALWSSVPRGGAEPAAPQPPAAAPAGGTPGGAR
jgi:hypothetical protein